jgi:hypothetical protein
LKISKSIFARWLVDLRNKSAAHHDRIRCWCAIAKRQCEGQSEGGVERFKTTVVKDLRYLKERDWFSNFAFQVFHKYFPDRLAFDNFVDSIAGDEEKSRFLKVASHYKFLVKDGRFSIPQYEEAKDFDRTYRFVGLVALIESVESQVSFKDFYTWLGKLGTFPIQGQQALDAVHEQYKSQFGVMHKMVSFFLRLDASSKQEIESWMKINGQSVAIEKLARTLYDIRSKFVHQARLIVDLSGMKTWSARHKGREITITLEQLERIFERGVLLRFGYATPASWPK